MPVQVSAEGRDGDAPPSPQRNSDPMEVVEEEEEFDAEDPADFWEPRSIRAPSEGFVGRSRIGSQAPVEDDAPPGYSPFGQAPVEFVRSRQMSAPSYHMSGGFIVPGR